MSKRRKAKLEYDDAVENLLDIVNEITEPEDLKEVVCPFYKGGKARKCYGCKQEDEIVDGCKDSLIEGLLLRPVYGLHGAVFNTEFDLPMTLARESKVLSRDTISLGLMCNTCHVSDTCPTYKENYECGIDWTAGVDTSNPKEMLTHLISIQMERVERSRKMELVDGGMPDQTTSSEMDRLTGMIHSRNDLDQTKFSMNISASGGESASAGGGILAKLFGGGNQQEALPEQNKDLIIDAETVEEIAEPIKLKRDENKN